MPREEAPSPVRRVMMQWIMWVILGLTVVAAAAVNAYQKQALRPVLGEVVIHRGVTFKLPTGWIGSEADREDGDTLIRRSQQLQNVLIVSVRQRPFSEYLGLTRQTAPAHQKFIRYIDLGGAEARLMQISTERDVEVLEVSRGISKGRVLGVVLYGPGGRDLDAEIDLIERIAKEVEVDPNY